MIELAPALERMAAVPRLGHHGRISQVVGLVMEATGIDVPLGAICRVRPLSGHGEVLAEAVGFHANGVLLMPFGELEGIHPGSSVEAMGLSPHIEVGQGLLGRVLNAMGEPIDGLGPLRRDTRVPLAGVPINPLVRETIDEALVTGIRSIDGPLTLGHGQRVGIFAGSGVGKSSLLGSIARGSSADVNVIALLGERGREVRDFLHHSLGDEGLSRSVVIAATGDEAALLRARGALVATAIAEHFRSNGLHVLLMVDSVTRVAMAWREIGLAVGEPPTTKGYPPSVFANLPRLLERAGNDDNGSITGIYTVLVEGDDFNDPIADAARSILDGHVVLSRRLATSGHFPAVDVNESVSRLRDRVVADEHRKTVNAIQHLLAVYREKEDLIAVGAYQPGSDPDVDRAIATRSEIIRFLRQDTAEISSQAETQAWLDRLSTLVRPSEARA